MAAMDEALEVFGGMKIDWSGLLVGNGASAAVSDKFLYKSLYEESKASLQPQDQQLFEHLRTRNFEQVLSALASASAVNGIFGIEKQDVVDAYQRIQNALLTAVHAVHLGWEEASQVLAPIRDELLKYDFVYSTNYDLLLYWSVNQDPTGFKDYFWGTHFNLGNTEIWGKVTKLLFLHGGLHLYRTANGTLKRKAEGYTSLLELFESPSTVDDIMVPLFITEGTSVDKLKSIYGNDYLSFAYTRFSQHQGPLCIVGQSLDLAFDKHLIDAIRLSPNKVLGIGIYPIGRTPGEIIAEKAQWVSKFPQHALHFFDSTTHPLVQH